MHIGHFDRVEVFADHAGPYDIDTKTMHQTGRCQ
jgi:hypothetical protein